MSNEFFNIWTHLIGFMLMCIRFIQTIFLLKFTEGVDGMDYFVFNIFFISSSVSFFKLIS